MKKTLLLLLTCGILFTLSPITAYAEELDETKEGDILTSENELRPLFKPNTISLQQLSTTEDALIEAAKDTPLQGLTNAGGTVPTYYFYYISDVWTPTNASLPLKGKILLYVTLDNTLDTPDIHYKINNSTLKWVAYTSQLKGLAFVLHEDKFIPVSEYYDILNDTRYSTFLTATSYLNANYGISANNAPSMYVQTISMHSVSIRDQYANIFPSYSYHRLEKFESEIFKNVLPSDGSELYNMYVWSLALLLLYYTIGKPALELFSFKGKGATPNV